MGGGGGGLPVHVDVTDLLYPVKSDNLENLEGTVNVAVEGEYFCVDDSLYSNNYSDLRPGSSRVFIPPLSEGGRAVEIREECTRGDCSCDNLIGGLHCSLRPCRVGKFLFDGSCTLPSAWVNIIWNGLCDGFKIVDEGFSSEYDCENYLSITQSHFRGEMSKLLLDELAEGKVSLAEEKPPCIHALGAVPKSDGRLRPITDCSLPADCCVNAHMSTTCNGFVYNSERRGQ